MSQPVTPPPNSAPTGGQPTVWKWLSGLIDLPAHITDQELRYRLQLVISLLLFAFFAGASILIFEGLGNPGAIDDADYLTLLTICAGFVPLYLRAKRGFIRFPAITFIGLVFLLCTAIPYTTNSLPSLPYFIVIPIFLTSIFFPSRYVVGVTIGAVVVSAIFYFTISAEHDYAAWRKLVEINSFTLTSGGFLWVYINHRRIIERYRREELVTAYDRVRASEAELEKRVAARTDELSKSREELHINERRYRQLVENTRDALFTSNVRGKFTYISPSTARLTGYSEQQLLEMRFNDVVAPDFRHTVARFYIEQSRRQTSETLLEFPILTAGGARVWVEQKLSALKDDHDQLVGFQAIVRDITERKLNEERTQAFLTDLRALQEMHIELSAVDDVDALYPKMIRASQKRLGIDRIAVLVIDPETNELTGTYGVGTDGSLRDERYYREEITPDHWTLDVYNSPKYTQFWDNAPIFDDSQVIGTGWKAASALRDGDKAIGYIVSDNFLTQSPARPYQAEIIALLGNSFSDLIRTKRTQALLLRQNRELVVARKEAESASALKSQFLASMSHELRTPLNAIIGYTQIMLFGMVGEISEEQAKHHDRILVNANHLLGLINGVLDLSKIEAGHADLEPARFNLRECIEEVIAQNAILAEKKGLTLKTTLSDGLPESVVADRGRLKQIIINLLSNAVKFTDTGSVTLTVSPSASDYWKFTVTDTGVGIPRDQQEAVFAEFRQTKEGSERGGTGLGLAIVQRLVVLMGGSITLDSEVGKGTSFTVILPINATP